MNIAFYLGSMNNGGAERVVANLSNHLCGKHRILILTSVRKKPVYELDERIEMRALDGQEHPPGNKIKRNIARIHSLLRELKTFQAEILISFLSEPCFRSLLVKRWIGIPVIISQRNDPQEEYKSLLYQLLMRWLFPRADGFVFQTELQKTYFSERIQTKSKVIVNPVAEEYRSAEYKYPLSHEIISIGRLDTQKNFPLLIDAFQKFVKRYTDYKLYIYGEGPERIRLEAMIRKKGLEDAVFLSGRTEDIKEKLLSSEFFVLSSDFEGMPNALIEAMSMGMPVISTDCPCGGPAELIEYPDMGILVKTGDRDGLTEAMCVYAGSHETAVRYGVNGRGILKKVSLSTVAGQWENYIQEIRKQRGSGTI